MNIKQWVLDNIFTSKGINPRKSTYNFLEYHPEAKNEIIKLTSFLSKNCRISERIYCIMNDINNLTTCNYEKCNNKVFYISYNQGYKSFCSANCSSKSNITKKKIIESNKKKFGTKWFSKTKEYKEKVKQTCIEKYGTDNPSKNEEIKEKTKQTNIKKYGVENTFQNKEIKEKIKQINLKRYNVENISQNKSIQQKIRNTNNKKHGVDYYSQHEKCWKKGLEYNKLKNNGKFSTQSHINDETLNKLNNEKWLHKQHHNNKKSIYEISKTLNVSHRTVLNYFIKNNLKAVRHSFSSFEKELLKYILINNIDTNNRNIIPPYELDIYIPEFNLAIEFNGLYWHSKHNKNYHLNKTEMCQEKGIQLLHIFENEWINSTKQDIWKSIINNKLSRNNRIFARKTEIKEITDNKIVKEFLDNNHLQGHCNSSVKLGLFYNNELVSIMTFGKTRFSKKYEWEMIRFCNKKFNAIIGGASKLYKYFVTNYKPKSVISYADRRYSDGNLYKKLGFEFIHNSNPNYWYFKNGTLNLYSRVKFQKHKLSSLLEVFDNNKSEVENMKNNGYLRIFDCGNMIYTWSKNEY